MTVDVEPPGVLSARARVVLDDLIAQGIGDEVAAWRQNALAAGQSVTGADQRRFATSVIQHRLGLSAERDIANGVDALTPDEDAAVLRAALDEMFGAGMLDRLLADPGVENIDAFGCDRVWVSYADGRKELGPQLWRSDTEMIDHLRRLGARSGQTERRFDQSAVELNLQLANGARLFAVMAVTTRPCLSVRRHRKASATLADLRATAMFDERVEAFLAAAVRARLNMLIAGGTNAGKTTLSAGPARRGRPVRTADHHRGQPRAQPRPARRPPPRRGGHGSPRRQHRRRRPDHPGRAGPHGTSHEPVAGDRRRSPRRRGDPDAQRHVPGQRRVDVHHPRVVVPGRVRPGRLLLRAGPRTPRPGGRQPAGGQRHRPGDLHRPGRHRYRACDRRVSSIREITAAEDTHVASNEIFRVGPSGHAEPSGVPLRPATAARLEAVGYSWPPALQMVR